MKRQDIMSAREIWQSKKVYWIKTYKTLLRYIAVDYVHIFKPMTKGSKSGSRYYVKKENLDKFIEMFEANQLNESTDKSKK